MKLVPLPETWGAAPANSWRETWGRSLELGQGDVMEHASAYRLDDAVNAACDVYEPREWGQILDALAGRAPRTKAGKLLRMVRDRARVALPEAVRRQRHLIETEQRYWAAR